MTVHLYHFFRNHPVPSIGFSCCGERLPREFLTKFEDDNECDACTAADAKYVAERNAPQPEPIATATRPKKGKAQ